MLGASRRGRLAHLLSPGVGLTTAASSGAIDVHLVTHEEVGRGRRVGSPRSALTARRRLIGFALAIAGLPLLTLLLTSLRDELSLPSDMLPTWRGWSSSRSSAGSGRRWSPCAVGSLLLNYYFTPPIHMFTIAEHENVLALIVFLAVAVAVSVTVDIAARRTREAAVARAEAETLSTLAGSVVRGSRVLPALLDQLREAYGFSGVTLLERRPEEPGGPDVQHDPDAWRVAAAVGDQPSLFPGQGDADVAVDDQFSLVLRGHPLAAADRRVVEAFAAQAAVALRAERLTEQAATVGSLSEVDKMRTALLSAVSHDLRTPLASARAAVDGLRSSDVAFSDADRDELLSTVDESLERLTRLVDNLLDMSRLQAGALGFAPQPMSMADAVARALDDLGPAGRRRRAARAGRAAGGQRRSGTDRTRSGQPAGQRAALQPGRTGRRWYRSATTPATSRRASSTTVRAFRRPNGTRCSCRSSDSAIATTTPASDSASRCPAGWPRRWAAR